MTGNTLSGKERLGATDNIEFSYEKNKIEGTNKIQTLILIKDIENGLNKIEYPDGDILNCNGKNQIAIDYIIEKEVEYKFKIISNNGYEKEEIIYESKPAMLYLYNVGDKCKELTGGWCKASDINASTDIDNYNYFDLDSKTMDGNMAIISTNKSIDITNYTKLKLEASVTKNGDIIASKNWGYTIGLNNPKQIGLKVPTDPHKYSAGLKQEEGEEIILEKDITDTDGEYFIGISTTAFHIKIHKVWLE